MIIDRFGTTYATAFQLSQHNAIDDYTISRPAVAARVGGMDGAFDFYGSNNYPILPLIVKKNLTLVSSGAGTVTGTGTLTGSAGGPPWYLYGTSTAFLSEVCAGDTIYTNTFLGIMSSLVTIVVSDTVLVVDNITNYGGGVYSIIRSGISKVRVEGAISAIKAATIAQGESKLWALLRDATRHWAWAKCTSLKTADQVGNVYHLPASIEFFCREGLWYSESVTTDTLTQAATQPAPVSVSGNHTSTVIFTFTSATGTMTALTLTNAANGDTFTWTGSAVVGAALVVNSGAYITTLAGAGAYSGLATGANQINWFRLMPGVNNITLAVTGSTAWTATIVRYDTYL